MELTQKELELWMASVDALGPVKRQALLEFFGAEREIYQASKSALLEVAHISEKDCAAMEAAKKEDALKRAYEKLNEQKIRLVSVHDAEYPSRLRQIQKQPYALFVRGNLPREDKVSIAIVGARNCTSYGKEMAQWFGKELSNCGIQVISGMAYGIDSYAHMGAIQGQEKTYAVLGCGIDICYPKENFSLYMHMCQQGGVISEYGPGVPGRGFQFPMRNRIISGLSDGILVVEARERSGSLITVDLGLEQGKDIFTIPGKVGDACSKGCLNLLKQGAEPVTSPLDIIENFHIQTKKESVRGAGKKETFSVSEQKLISALSMEPKHINQILEDTRLMMTEAIAALLQLELRGVIAQPMPNYYMCNIEWMENV